MNLRPGEDAATHLDNMERLNALCRAFNQPVLELRHFCQAPVAGQWIDVSIYFEPSSQFLGVYGDWDKLGPYMLNVDHAEFWQDVIFGIIEDLWELAGRVPLATAGLRA